MSAGRPAVDLDTILGPWLEEAAGAHRPDYLPAVLARTRRTRQRPAWTFPSRWLPAKVWRGPVFVPRLAWQLLVLGLLLALIGAIAIIGARRAPSPMELGRPGLIAFDIGHRIAVMDAEGTSFRYLTPSTETAAGPAWSPDGQRLAFWRANGTGHWTIAVMSPDGQLQAEIASSATTPLPYPSGDPRWSSVEFDLGVPSPLAWSWDSRRIAFAQRVDGAFGIWAVEAEGSGLRRLTGPSLTARDPAWSPDGSLIAFRGGSPESADEGVWAMAGDGREPRRLSTVESTGEAFRYPQWEPNGKRLVFVALPAPSGKAHVFLVGADGTGERDLTAATADPSIDDWLPSWSPDGKRIACMRFTADRVNGELLLMDPESGLGIVPPGLPDRLPGIPMWSPDARSITVLIGDPVDGTPEQMVLLDLADGRPPRTFLMMGNAGETSWQRLPR